MRRNQAGNAVVSVRDLDTEEDLEVELPWEHRHHWVGWGEKPRLRFSGNRWGVEVGRGDGGVRVVDHEGRGWFLPENSYQTVQRRRSPPGDRGAVRPVVAMRKAAKDEDVGFAGAFASAKGAGKATFIDSMWRKIQSGEAIERKGPVEHKLRDAQKAGKLKSRNDVHDLVEKHYDTSHLAGSAADAISPAERAASAKNKPPAAGASTAPPGSGPPERHADGSLRESADEKAQRQHAFANKELIQGGAGGRPSRSSPSGAGGSAPAGGAPAGAAPSRPAASADTDGDGSGGSGGGAATHTAGKKASAAGGERWITVHPHGDDEPGVPVKIVPNPDGTHRIVGGAGGKLNHLRLKNVKPDTPENREAAAEKGKARKKKKAGDEAERRAGQSEEQNAAEDRSKDEIKAAEREAERKFVDKVRSTAGGVDADLTPEQLGKFRSDGARNLEIARLHRKQFKQAMARTRELAQAKVDQDLTHTERRVQIEQALDDEPDLGSSVRSLAEAELDLQAADEKERAAERRANRTRTTSTRNVGEQAAEQARKVLDETKDPEEKLKHLGGRVDPKAQQAMALSRTPSEEVERRSVQSLQDAVILHKAANGEELQEDEQKVLETIAKKTEIDPEDEHALRREAARQLRRSEIQGSQAKKLKDLETGGDTRKAEMALAYTDMLKGIADDAKVARQLGLTEAEKTPISEPELAAISELMADSGKLRDAKKQFKAMMAEAEGGDYDASRRAFELKVEDAPDHVAETEAEMARQGITKRLLGIADPKHEAHIQAVAEGHYHALAEIGLGIGKSRYLDRPTIDAIGARNACVLQRWALERDGHQAGDVLESLEQTHVGQLVDTSARAIARAEAFVPDLAKTVENVGDLEQALAQLDAHEQEIDEVQREVGGALGKMEALATQAQAFRKPMPEHLEIQARDQWDNAIQWLHAAGLRPGDYELNRKDKTVRIPQKAWGKLVNQESPEVQRTREAVDEIKAGKHDEEGWLPPGFVSRSASSFNTETKGAQRFWEPLALPGEAGGYKAAVEAHVGRRIADGEAPEDVLKDLNSASILAQAKDPDAYGQVLRDVFPIRGEDGELQPLSKRAGYFQKLADQAVQRDRPGESPLHAQGIDLDHPDVQEAIYRTLAKEPRLKLAHMPVSAMSAEDRGALRSYFYEKMKIDPKKGYAEAFGKEAADLGTEPSKTAGTMSMFGGGGGEPSAEWKQWRDKALSLARKYPAEGKDLALKALGDRPAAKKSPRITPAVEAAIAKVRAENPDASVAEITNQARAELAPELSEAQHGTARETTSRQMRIEQQQWLEKHPNATEADATAALKDRSAKVLQGEQVKTRAGAGPQLQPADVHALIAPELHDAAVEQVKGWSAKSTPWQTYVEMHGGLEHANQALQDELGGKFAEGLAKHHEQITGKPLRLGKADVANRERHIFATGTPEQQAAYRQQRGQDLAALQQRDAVGRYGDMGGAGQLLAKEKTERERDRAAAQQQGGLFGFGGGKAATHKEAMPEIRLEEGQRHTLGERVENQLRSVMPTLGGQLASSKSGVHLFPDANMDGDRIHQQRSLKQLDANGGRLGLYGGVGFGKTPVMFGALTSAIEKGEAKHGGLFLVPSKVQPQFDSEMSSFLEPGKYKWATGEGASHDERVAMLKNPDLHARVMTHAAFMRTAQKLVADHHGWKPNEVGEKLGAMSAKDSAKAYRAAMDANGIPPMFTAVDEAHTITHRDSTDWGSLHALGRAATHPINASHALFATATPHKNDTSEMYSMASLVDPDRYADREKFMASFGGGVSQNPESIRRELSHLTYSAAIPPQGVTRTDLENPTVGENGEKTSSGKPLPMLPAHQKLMDQVEADYTAAAKAHASGKVDAEAVKRLAAPGRFEGVPDEEHEQIAKDLGRSLPILRDSARRRALELAPAEHNTKLQAMSKVIEHDLQHGEWTDSRTGEKKKGKVPIVFANSAQAVDLIRQHFADRGHRVETITGSTSPDELRKTLGKFPRPEAGQERKADILIGTASIEAGLNAQFAQTIHHFDVPPTEKAYNQRNGRAYRQNQRADVETHSWHADTEYDRAARLRLKRKTGLANVFQTSTPHLDESGIASTYQAIRSARHQAQEPEALAAK